MRERTGSSAPRAGASGAALDVAHLRELCWAAVRSGVSAALAGLFGALVVTAVCWLPDAGISGHPVSVFRAGILAFLSAHGGGIVLDGTPAHFLPMGMLLFVVLVARRAGVRLAESACLRAGMELTDVALALFAQTIAYVVCVGLLVPVGRLGTSHVAEAPTIGAALILFGLVSGLSVLGESGLLAEPVAQLPVAVRAGGVAAAGGLTVYLLSGTVVALGSLALHAHEVMHLSGDVGGGLSGFPIAVIGALAVPNAAVIGTAYVAGPGFSAGVGTSVNAFVTNHGLLPAFPLLGAIPTGQANPVVLVVMVAAPLSAGIVAARLLRGHSSTGEGVHGPLPTLGAIVTAAGLAGLGMALLAWLSGGGIGNGRLRVFGPSAWQSGLAVAGGLGACTLTVLGGAWIWRAISNRSGAESPTEPEPEPELASVSG